MSLSKRGRYWHYEFQFDHVIYRKSTFQELREDAAAVEREAMRQVRRKAMGLEPTTTSATPSFTQWAETCFVVKGKKLRRMDIWKRTARMVLAFWGRRPTKEPPVDGGVYHDLRLGDPIADPMWIDRFEKWMDRRGIAGATRNTYFSALSGMYRVAMRPRFRQKCGVKMNPFLDVDRPARKKRKVKLSPTDLRAWIQQAPPHAVLALTIGATAAKLRLDQVLSLRFDEHLNRELTLITFDDYKSVGHRKGEPQVTVVPDDLREVLVALRNARPEATHVITFRGKPVKSIKRATKTAAESAGLKWGVKNGGVTFHALRHAFATEAAAIGVGAVLTGQMLDHADPRTTQQFYTHIEALKQKPAMDLMAAHFGLKAGALKAVGVLVRADARKEQKALGKRRKIQRPFQDKKSA